MTDDFKDHFSKQSKFYADCRPTYPEPLFDYLATLVPATARVWDCATGNGQAAQALAGRFAEVIATDASANQIANARPVAGVEYRISAAENSGLSNNSVDLITVAQALHWFDFPAFFAEVERVLRPGGVLAVWGYELFQIDPAMDAVIGDLYSRTLRDYWPPERRLLERGYADIVFPYPPLPTPAFAMETEWTLEQITGYLRSWSAVQNYRSATGRDPVADIAGELTQTAQPRNRIRWPLILKLSVKP